MASADADDERKRLVGAFIARYRRELDFYEQASRLVAQSLESRLQAEGIRAIVTSRAKSVSRLEPKVLDRAKTAKYSTVEDIYDDIVDLAGVRVALYFPGQRDQVGRLIEEMFAVFKWKKFPVEEKTNENPSEYQKRFSGYWATHFRARLKEASLAEAQKRYADARVEIQVASVLMHAWAEVEHDLVYKPLQGALSLDEHAILDELNGLVIAGEISLERLQRAGEVRVASADRKFANHFELATHLLSQRASDLPAAAADAALGNVDLLFDFLTQLDLASPAKIRPLLQGLHDDFELRPIAEQIIDQLLAEDSNRYEIYEKLRSERGIVSIALEGEAAEATPSAQEAFHKFMSSWIAFEQKYKNYAEANGFRAIGLPNDRVLSKLPGLTEQQRQDIGRLRRMRNYVVHGVETPPPEELLAGAKLLKNLAAKLDKKKE